MLNFNKIKYCVALITAAYTLPALSLTQDIPIQINGTFNSYSPPCQNTFLNETLLFDVTALNKVGDEDIRMASLSLDCDYDTTATIIINTPVSTASNQAFATTSDSFGVKLAVNNKDFTPGSQVALPIVTGRNTINFNIKLTKLTLEPSYGNHSFKLDGILAVDYN